MGEGVPGEREGISAVKGANIYILQVNLFLPVINNG